MQVMPSTHEFLKYISTCIKTLNIIWARSPTYPANAVTGGHNTNNPMVGKYFVPPSSRVSHGPEYLSMNMRFKMTIKAIIAVLQLNLKLVGFNNSYAFLSTHLRNLSSIQK